MGPEVPLRAQVYQNKLKRSNKLGPHDREMGCDFLYIVLEVPIGMEDIKQAWETMLEKKLKKKTAREKQKERERE